MAPSDARKVFDAVVVGSGAAGGWVAKTLAEGGARVALLEAGPMLEAARDFPTPPPPERGVIDRVGAIVGGQAVQARGGLFLRRTRHLYVNDREHPYSTPKDKPFIWLRGRQLGGRLHTWVRHVPRLSAEEFQPRNDHAADLAWPLTYAEVAPYYDIVESVLGVHGEPERLACVPDGIFLKARSRSPMERLFVERSTRHVPSLRVIDARTVKYSPERMPIPIRLALATGRTQVMTDAIVSHIIVDKNSGKAAGVACVDRVSKKSREIFAKTVVLCASAIESVRILLNSRGPQHPAGIGGSSGVLGRYLGDHIATSHFGAVGSAYDDRSPQALDLEDGYDFALSGLYVPDCASIWPSDRVSGSFGLQISVGRFGRGWSATGFGGMLPRYDNHVRLSVDKTDAWGIPTVHIECSHAGEDIALFHHMSAVANELATVAGLGISSFREQIGWPFRFIRRWVFAENGMFWPGMAIHETGGARMGTDPATSVLNRYNQCWDADNVFVTDGACFPSAGYKNHTLTIMALSVRAAEFIVREYLPRKS